MSDDRQNVVLVTVDSLRADHCGYWGYEKDTTPTLDSMAEDGMVFENAIAPGPATPESMPVIFTGEWPIDREGNADSELANRRERIKAHMEARETLPERMQRLGYETAAFTPNPFTSRHFGFDQGFDHFEDFMDESNRGPLYQKVFQGFLEDSGLSSMARVFMNFWQGEEVFKPWESYYDNVIEWVQGTDEPYFLWVFLMDAHNPYMASGEYRTQSKWQEFHANFEFWRQSHETPFSDTVHDRLVTAYDDSIRYSDAFLEQLRGDLEDAVIAVHGDHGEAFGEHGTYGHEPYLYPENVHVPLVVDGVEAESVSDSVSLANMGDLLSTVGSAGSPTEIASEFEVSRTRDGQSVAIHTPDGYLRQSDSKGSLSAHVEDSPIVARHHVDRHERDTIVSAVSKVCRGEGV